MFKFHNFQKFSYLFLSSAAAIVDSGKMKESCPYPQADDIDDVAANEFLLS